MSVTVLPEQRVFLARPRMIGLDLDGTLVDSAPDIAWAANCTLAELGLPTLAEDQVCAMIGDGIDILLQRCLAASAGSAARDEALLARARPVLMRHYGENIFQRGIVFPGVFDALHQWIYRGITLVCVTNKAGHFAELLLRQSSLWPLLAGLYSGDLDRERKPAPHLIQRCLADFAVAPKEFLMIGDSIHDLDAARVAGCPAVAVNYGYGEPAALATAGCPIVERLDDLTFG